MEGFYKAKFNDSCFETAEDVNEYVLEIYSCVENELRELCMKYNVGSICLSDNVCDWITDWWINMYGEDISRIPSRDEVIRGVFECANNEV